MHHPDLLLGSRIPPDLSAQIRLSLERAGFLVGWKEADLRIDPTFFQPTKKPRQMLEEIVQSLVRAGMRFLGALKALFTPPNPPVRRRHRKRPRCYVRAKPHRRNTRVHMVQAKRCRLDLSPDGKIPWLRASRKDCYALRAAEECWYLGLRAERPNPREYEHVPARRRKKEVRRLRKYRRTEECAGGVSGDRIVGGRERGPELLFSAGTQIFPGAQHGAAR
jgi:hypothetical protein